ncbi:MAG: tRNA nucleotidyltransferase, partial [Bacteroidota bacterium]
KYKVKKYLDNFRLVRQRCQEVEKKDFVRTWQPPVTGEKIMEVFNIPPSKPVGDIKNAIKDAILDGVIANTYEAAYAFMLEEAKKMGLKIPA